VNVPAGQGMLVTQIHAPESKTPDAGDTRVVCAGAEGSHRPLPWSAARVLDEQRTEAVCKPVLAPSVVPSLQRLSGNGAVVRLLQKELSVILLRRTLEDWSPGERHRSRAPQGW